MYKSVRKAVGKWSESGRWNIANYHKTNKLTPGDHKNSKTV